MIYRILGHCVLHGRRKEIGTLQKVAKTSVFYALQWERLHCWTSDFLKFWRSFRVAGTALPMTRLQFFVASAVLSTLQMETSPRAVVRSRKLCSQHLQNGGSLAKLLRFQLCNFHFWRKSRAIAACLLIQLRFLQAPCRFARCSSVRQLGGSDRSARYKGKYKVRSKR